MISGGSRFRLQTASSWAKAAVKEMTMAKVSFAAAAIGGMLAACAPLSVFAGETAVLDLHAGSYRGFVRYKLPTVVDEKGETVPLLEPRRRGQKPSDRQPMKVVALPAPPADWNAPAFDDTGWPRVRGVLASGISRPSYPVTQSWRATGINMVCARGAFRVTDPAAVKELKLELVYIGGCVVYVNGREVARGHLPEGKLTTDTLAEPYPREAYLGPDGHIWPWPDQLNFHRRNRYRRELIDSPLGKLRMRKMGGVKVPADLLRKGINVVAVEVHTAPISDLLANRKSSLWNHAGLHEARLAAPAANGLVPNVGPGPGLAVQVISPGGESEPWDYAHPADGVGTICMIGARGGTFSGVAMFSSSGDIRGLRASAGALKLEGGEGEIPASALSLRCAVGDSGELLQIPEEIKATSVYTNAIHGESPPTASARLWLSVRVPNNAQAGLYRSTMKVTAAEAEAITIPVELRVYDWRVPLPAKQLLHHHIYQSPESVALYYKVPLWSEKHFELIGKSFAILDQIGNRMLAMNLVADAWNWGNRESMVRWSKDGKGGYTYDFSIVEKYMDQYAANCAEPGAVMLSVWGHAGWPQKRMPQKKVTVVDPATGQTSLLEPPPLGTAENEAFWRPVLTEMRKRLEKRGWYEQTAVAYTSYTESPSKEMAEVYRNIWPDGQWLNCSHSHRKDWYGMPVRVNEWVWGSGRLYNPDADAGSYPRPWKRLGKRVDLTNPRIGTGVMFQFAARKPPIAFRLASEACLQGDLHGMGKLGADFWSCIADRHGRMRTMDLDEFGVGFRNTVRAMLSPGPEGAVFNERLEMFREGLQVAEAIVQVQRGLESDRLEPAIVKRIESLLDERARYYLHTQDAETDNLPWWGYQGSSWRERDARLFALAAEVSAVLAESEKPGQ
jgi:hypothetical protein